MRYLKFIWLLVALPLLLSADEDYPPFVIDGIRDDWFWKSRYYCGTYEYFGDVLPDMNGSKGIDLVHFCCFIDRKYGKFFGLIEVAGSDFFSDSLYTCYEVFFDRDTCNYNYCPEGNPGDSIVLRDVQYNDWPYWPEIRPDYRFKFCGSKGIVKEVRYRYWNGSSWIGSPKNEDARFTYAFKEHPPANGNRHFYTFEFEFDGLAEMNYAYFYPINDKYLSSKGMSVAVLATKSHYYDAACDGISEKIPDFTAIEAKTWQEVKTK